MTNKFQFRARLWLYPGETGNWHFISLPKKIASIIREAFGELSRGWGSFRVEVVIGSTTWQTSIFPDNKRGTYILPVKAVVRRQEQLTEDQLIDVRLSILL